MPRSIQRSGFLADRSDIQIKCAVLTAFTNEIRAQRGKKFNPRSLTGQLIADAQAIMIKIGCS